VTETEFPGRRELETRGGEFIATTNLWPVGCSLLRFILSQTWRKVSACSAGKNGCKVVFEMLNFPE
jgi:hypothetical protein